jgi:hypothetical protein
LLTDVIGNYRTVPTQDQILVPETLLKKRKSQEKAREQRTAEIEKRKKVSNIQVPSVGIAIEVMHNTKPRLGCIADAVGNF